MRTRRNHRRKPRGNERRGRTRSVTLVKAHGLEYPVRFNAWFPGVRGARMIERPSHASHRPRDLPAANRLNVFSPATSE
jgi:hypothetical protein